MCDDGCEKRDYKMPRFSKDCPLRNFNFAENAYHLECDDAPVAGNFITEKQVFDKNRKCVQCNVEMTVPSSFMARVYIQLFSGLLGWDHLPVLCFGCWKLKKPLIAAAIEKHDFLSRRICSGSKGFFIMAHIPTDEQLEALKKELSKRYPTFKSDEIEAMLFDRSAPGNWWRNLSFVEVEPVCISFNRFIEFCTNLLSIKPELNLAGSLLYMYTNFFIFFFLSFVLFYFCFIA